MRGVPTVCDLKREEDFLIFEAPELERTAAFLSLRSMEVKIEDDGVRLRITPPLEGLEESLASLCAAMPSQLLLDLAEMLASEGWLVLKDKGIVRLRRSLVSGGRVAVFECDCVSRRLRVYSTSDCLLEKIKGMGANVDKLLVGFEATLGIKSLIDVLNIADSLKEAFKEC